MLNRSTLLIACALGFFSTERNALRADSPDFERDVMPVLSRTGCNMGACHGNLHGKGGFRLSLRGQSPADDYLTIVRALEGRRIDRNDPAASLLLAKPSGAVSHGGGLRLASDSPEFAIVRDWIAGGTKGINKEAPKLTAIHVSPTQQILSDPESEFTIHAEAEFADGTRKNVTELAVYETSNLLVSVDREGCVKRESFGEATILVRYLHLQTPVRIAFLRNDSGFAWQAPEPKNDVDEHLFAKLKTLRMNPSPPADDHVFVRRAYLDAIGTLPSLEEAQAFVRDSDPEKRTKLIDKLLERPEFADFWTVKFSDILRNEEKALDERGVAAFHGWIRDTLANDRPLDRFVYDIITARGSTYTNPAANFYRANRDPFTRAETAARLFLGVRLGCAKCHNHPFDTWKQDDYYAWSAWFARIDYQILSNNRRDKLDLNSFNGEQVVMSLTTGDVTNPRTQRIEPPRFLGDATPPVANVDDRAVILAEWLTSRNNKQFARTFANFTWYHLLGRGIVEPIDDVRATNPPSNPELLDALAENFAADGFRLKKLIRTIMTSHAYGLSSEPNASNIDDEANFARAIVRRLTAEQLLDAQASVLGKSPQFDDYRAGTRAVQVQGVKRSSKPKDGDRFLKTFGKPDRLLACECERSAETTLNQAFLTLSDEGLQERLTADDNRFAKWVSSGKPEETALDAAYWLALSRPPTSEESEAFLKSLDGAADRREILQDWLWAVLHSKEFMFRR